MSRRQIRSIRSSPLADVGMVLLRDNPASADGQLVAITT
jgi:hypothetical protein